MSHAELVAIIGAGRLGTAMAAALRSAGVVVQGPLGRGQAPEGADVVLMCVPDAAIAEVADSIAPGPLVGHCSGATTLEPLAGHRAFSLHPLLTAPADGVPHFHGVPCAVAGDEIAVRLATTLGMKPLVVADADRAAYHAAASMASNFLVTLEVAAERVAATAGLSREDLLPLVQATVDNWAALGAAALTGPIARGDHETVARHREALAERAPDLLDLYDTLAEATRR